MQLRQVISKPTSDLGAAIVVGRGVSDHLGACIAGKEAAGEVTVHAKRLPHCADRIGANLEAPYGHMLKEQDKDVPPQQGTRCMEGETRSGGEGAAVGARGHT